MRATIAAVILLSSAAALAAPNQRPPQGGNDQRPQQGGAEPQRRGPPPEALEACRGKAAGSVAEMRTPRGDVVKGKCQMVIIPDQDGRERDR